MTTTCLCLRVGQESQQNTQSSLQSHFGDDLKLIQKKKKMCGKSHHHWHWGWNYFLGDLLGNFVTTFNGWYLTRALGCWRSSQLCKNVRFPNPASCGSSVRFHNNRKVQYLWWSLLFFSWRLNKTAYREHSRKPAFILLICKTLRIQNFEKDLVSMA